jgi:hypothetical protein
MGLDMVDMGDSDSADAGPQAKDNDGYSLNRLRPDVELAATANDLVSLTGIAAPV